MIDDQSPAGSWKRALDRGCLEGRVFDYTPPQIADNDGFDFHAWVASIPGIPAWWGSGADISSASKPTDPSFHEGGNKA